MSNKATTKSSTQLRGEIAKLQTRHAELSEQLRTATERHQQAQQGLIQGQENSGEVAALFATVSSLREGIGAIDATLARLVPELEAAELFESQAGLRSKLKRAEKELAEAEACYRASRVQSDAALVEFVGAQVDSQHRWRRAQDEIVSLCRELGEEVPRFGPIVCPEPLVYGPQVDSCAQQLLNVERRQSVSREEALQARRERREREQRAQAAQVSRLAPATNPAPGWKLIQGPTDGSEGGSEPQEAA